MGQRRSCLRTSFLLVKIIFFDLIYASEIMLTWSLTLREEMKLKVSENMVLRRIFGPRRDEVTVEWRRLLNE